MDKERHHNLFLIGPMGSGKSTIGRLLARTLKKEYLDSDADIERSTGVDIPYIFEIEGEAGFRKREERSIARLAQRKNIVLATGGGAILSAKNRQVLSENGLVLYLNVSPKEQFNRVRYDTQRPLLFHENPEAVLAELYQKRHPFYSALADYTILSDKLAPKTVVNGIIEGIVRGKSPLPHWLVENSER